jgi:RNA polymerase sigma-70 factor (ECF subfamily)
MAALGALQPQTVPYDRVELDLMSARAIDIAGLYAAEQGRLTRYVKRFVRSRTAAEDLVQQAFVKLIDNAECGNLANVPAYLATIARNLALNHVRNTSLRGEVELSEAEFHAVADTRPSPEITAIYRSELRRVLEAVAALPPRRREAFVLHKFEELTYDEIAARQGVSRNTVITQIVCALADLDRRLGRK